MTASNSPSLRVGRQGARCLRERRFSTRALYLTCLVLTVLALLSFWPERRYGTLTSAQAGGLQARDLATLEASDDTCRLVHKSSVTDKCAFIIKHCPDEEPGFLAYLNFYYCSLGNVKPIAFIILMFWLGLLFSTIGIAASDFFCINLSTIATILGMSESLAGVTFLAFGNGSPDVFSTFAAMSTNSSSLAIGELIGAAGFITAVVAGSMALVRPFKVAKKSFVRDVGFFAVAAAFSMGFLSDGHLHLWECVGMVIYYVFYVIVVVVWHWWITRRAKRRARYAAARDHYSIPGVEEAEVQEEYLDDPDNESRSMPSSSRGASVEDFRVLEGSIPRIQEPDEDIDEESQGLLGEITGNMRLKRPGRHRRNTITPVRPSLVGALEFQAVLKSLNRSRNIQTIPMHARRYSDDPVYTLAPREDEHQEPSLPTVEQPPVETSTQDSSLHQQPPVGRSNQFTSSGRTRAVSANDAASLQLDPKLFHHTAQAPKLVQIAEDGSGSTTPHNMSSSHASSRSSGLLSPESATRSSSRVHSPAPSPREQRVPSPDFLQLPDDNFLALDRRRRLISDESARDSPEQSPRSRPKLSELRVPSNAISLTPSSPVSPFPVYNDNPASPLSRLPSLYMPPPASASVESQSFPLGDEQCLDEVKPPRWWPSRLLPSPMVLFSTLFPTLCNWRDKSWWEILLGLVAAPSIFLLTVTLPVVDTDQDDDVSLASCNGDPHRKFSGPQLQVITPQDDEVPLSSSATPGTGTAGVAAKAEQHQHRQNTHDTPGGATTIQDAPHQSPQPPPGQKMWNRWLTIVQLYLSPAMIVLILYTQYIPVDESLPFSRIITRPLLISLLISTILLIPLLLTTTPSHRPKIYPPLLSLVGFIVSIAWISTIAAQVVAVLKTFAIILNMSHAILGLTVFAVGNSLGDLVADITVARLGYPVMALSACFGGPMLNILLGIGLSGSYLLIRGAQKRLHKHPDRGWKSGTYEIQVGDTLVVSGVTLLLTLVGLLVAVPLNGWMMSRRIAWALIALWCAGTVVNVVLEVSGVGSAKGS